MRRDRASPVSDYGLSCGWMRSVEGSERYTMCNCEELQQQYDELVDAYESLLREYDEYRDEYREMELERDQYQRDYECVERERDEYESSLHALQEDYDELQKLSLIHI